MTFILSNLFVHISVIIDASIVTATVLQYGEKTKISGKVNKNMHLIASLTIRRTGKLI